MDVFAVGTLVANAEMIPGGTLCTKTSQAAAKPAQSCGVTWGKSMKYTNLLPHDV